MVVPRLTRSVSRTSRRRSGQAATTRPASSAWTTRCTVARRWTRRRIGIGQLTLARLSSTVATSLSDHDSGHASVLWPPTGRASARSRWCSRTSRAGRRRSILGRSVSQALGELVDPLLPWPCPHSPVKLADGTTEDAPHAPAAVQRRVRGSGTPSGSGACSLLGRLVAMAPRSWPELWSESEMWPPGPGLRSRGWSWQASTCPIPIRRRVRASRRRASRDPRRRARARRGRLTGTSSRRSRVGARDRPGARPPDRHRVPAP